MGMEKTYIVPLEKTNLIAEARKTGMITEENWLDDGIHVTMKAGGFAANARLEALMKEFETNESESEGEKDGE